MNISSFGRMRAYRKDGRIALILKLELPHIDSDDDAADVFNSFYEQLFNRISESADGLKREAPRGTAPDVLNVSFSDITKEYLDGAPNNRVAIKRIMRFRRGKNTEKREFVDVYDLKYGAFVK